MKYAISIDSAIGYSYYCNWLGWIERDWKVCDANVHNWFLLLVITTSKLIANSPSNCRQKGGLAMATLLQGLMRSIENNLVTRVWRWAGTWIFFVTKCDSELVNCLQNQMIELKLAHLHIIILRLQGMRCRRKHI